MSLFLIWFGFRLFGGWFGFNQLFNHFIERDGFFLVFGEIGFRIQGHRRIPDGTVQISPHAV